MESRGTEVSGGFMVMGDQWRSGCLGDRTALPSATSCAIRQTRGSRAPNRTKVSPGRKSRLPTPASREYRQGIGPIGFLDARIQFINWLCKSQTFKVQHHELRDRLPAIPLGFSVARALRDRSGTPLHPSGLARVGILGHLERPTPLLPDTLFGSENPPMLLALPIGPSGDQLGREFFPVGDGLP